MGERMGSARGNQRLRTCGRVALLIPALIAAGCEPLEPPFDVEPPPDVEPAPGALRISLEQVGSAVFALPVDVVSVPGTTDMLVVEQAGRVHRLDLDRPDAPPELVVDISSRVFGPDAHRETGLFSLALHPLYPDDARAYLSFTEPSDTAQAHSVVLEVPVLDDGTLDADAGRVVFELPQPRRTHNGGSIRFLPDGRLGIAMGDGGYQEEYRPNAQDPDSAYGALAAIDVDSLEDPPPLDVLAIGFRNPWKWSVDPVTEQIWLGDVGLRTSEELNRVEIGGNHGWPRYEGTVMRDDAALCEDCGPLVVPVVTYGREIGRAVIAGYVYRGSQLPELVGTHVFADNTLGKILGIESDAEGTNPPLELGETGLKIVGFGVDPDGELVALDHLAGGLHRVVRALDEPEPPALLSETGFVDPGDPEEPPEGALEYDMQWSFFADGADKRRWIQLPDDTVAEVTPDGDLELPVGTVLGKSFARASGVFETRALVHDAELGWRGYSYRWNEERTDADLLDGSRLAQIDGDPWLFPARSTCLSCHTVAAGIALGPTLAQLGGVEGEAVQAMIARGWLDADDVLAAGTPPLPASDDPTADLDDRARAYLDANCSMCHRPGGPAVGLMDLRFDTPEEDTGLCAPPSLDDFGLDDARFVAQGSPERSVLLWRVRAEGGEQMNPFRRLVDEDGADMLTEWVLEVACR
jgi:glucose/arabinose dehydrogenase/mono/diheme cytochrome c family protein